MEWKMKRIYKLWLILTCGLFIAPIASRAVIIYDQIQLDSFSYKPTPAVLQGRISQTAFSELIEDEEERKISIQESLVGELAEAALKQAYQQALASGYSVTRAENGALVEVSPDGTKIFIKELPPSIPVSKGQRIEIRPFYPDVLSLEAAAVLRLSDPIYIQDDLISTLTSEVYEIDLIFAVDGPPSTILDHEIVVKGSLFCNHTSNQQRRIWMSIDDWKELD